VQLAWLASHQHLVVAPTYNLLAAVAAKASKMASCSRAATTTPCASSKSKYN